jgi:NAD dependent epimerase/dehydratase family enzyme
MSGADVVINLAGRSLNCRYSEGNRLEMRESRVRSKVAAGRMIAGLAAIEHGDD